MSNLNSKLVESLDLLNHILAVVFFGLAIYKFIDVVSENFIAAIFESVAVIGVGILTCGYIALMLNINNVLEQIRDGRKR